jgi:elongation factor P
MLEYNEITPKKYIVYEDKPYEVLESHVARTQQRKPQNQTKIRNLITGQIIPVTFRSSDKVPEADIESKDIKYLYNAKGESWFCDAKDPSARFTLSSDIMGGREKFLKPNTIVDAMVFEDEVIGVRFPIKMELLVKEAAAAVKGNTVQGGSKQVVLETGVTVNVPMFINEGDLIRINTETGTYAERVDKK